jgi:hypothetical protein
MMDFKKCDEIFEALKVMRPEMVNAIFLEWADWLESKKTDCLNAQPAPKVAAVSEGYLHGSVFSKAELEAISSYLTQGYTQTEAATMTWNRFSRGRTLRAYKLRANQLAKTVRGPK